MWGTDWPHPGARALMPNDRQLADLLADWVPDEVLRRKVLVENPAGFTASVCLAGLREPHVVRP